MKRSIKHALTIVAVATFLTGCAAIKVRDGQKYSGFLKDYSQLKEEKDVAGDPVLRYITPQLSFGKYGKIMIDPVALYPAPKPNASVDAQTLNEIRAYFDQALRKKIGERVPIVQEPSPGVARLRVAITGAGGEKAALAPYEYIPIGLVVATAREAAGVRAKDATIYAEAELLDSVSGQPLGAAVKRATGEAVKGGESGKLTFAHVKPVLDRWAQVAADFAASYMRRR